MRNKHWLVVILPTNHCGFRKTGSNEDPTELALISDTLLGLFCEISPQEAVPFLKQNESACTDTNLKVNLNENVVEPLMYVFLSGLLKI